MSMLPNIQYVPHRNIDKEKWDHCIDKASNSLIYAYSWYLDYMARNWDALVLNDYEAVMPLTWNEKYGIRYLYQPFLAAQLGVFGKNINNDLSNHFLASIPSLFRYIDISLNSANNSGFVGMRPRANYVLDLNKSYTTLASQYSENISRNIKKATGCIIEQNIDAENVISLAIEQMKRYGKDEIGNVDRFRKLNVLLEQKKLTITYGVSIAGKLLSGAIFMVQHRRAYYILVGNAPEGKNQGASHALIDAFIRDHAGNDMKLDFEGSDIPGLASFYKGFGAEKEIYPALKINRLPFYLKWIKK